MPLKAKRAILDELAKASDHFPIELSCIGENEDNEDDCSKATENTRSDSSVAVILVVLGIILLTCVNPFFLLGEDINNQFGRGPISGSMSQSRRRIKVYSVARTDRGGSAIHEMLRYHAEAYARNMTYGGACSKQIDWSLQNVNQGVFRKRHKQRESLIATLGLTHQLPMACPSRSDLESGKAIFLDTKEMQKSRENVFTEEWLEYLQSQRKNDDIHEDLDDESAKDGEISPPIQVVVHVRRGDVTPCKYSKRYLPNSYYLQVLDRHLPLVCAQEHGKCNVTIFSEEQSFESFDVFRERGYHVALDSPLEQAWQSIVSADVAVISRSGFSQVPALLNRNVVVTPSLRVNDRKPGWVEVDKEIEQAGVAKREEFAAYCG